MKRKEIKKSAGFTLIEIMVAISIFVIVAFIVTSTLLAILDAGRRANKMRLVVDNMNFALDSMANKLKFGDSYTLSGESQQGYGQISFVDKYNIQTAYCLVTVDTKKQIFKCKGTLNCGETTSGCEPITTSEISVSDLRFKQAGCFGLSTCNRQFIILVKATAQYKNQPSIDLDFQTSVSQSLSQ